MLIEPAALPDIRVIRPKKHGDARGFFSETFKQSALEEAGIHETWIQDNHAFSKGVGVVRGLHFQAPPFAQAKLLRVTRGAILDVAVDIRGASPTYGRHAAVELSAEAWDQIYVPAGFAHGYCTLTEDTEVLYKVTAPYAPSAEGGLLWSDPALGIEWPIAPEAAILNDRDRVWPNLAALKSPF